MSVPRGWKLARISTVVNLRRDGMVPCPQWEDDDEVLKRNDSVPRLNGECVAEAPAAWIGMALNK